MKHRVVIIEDNIPLRDGFSEVIKANDNFELINCYDNCEEAIERLQYDNANIFLMDIELPGMNGVEGTKKIKAQDPNINILIVTVYENSETVFNALCAGASGYLTKNASPQQITNALDEVMKGGAPMSIHIAKMVVQSFQRAPESILSDRETEVLSLLASGKSYKSVADTMFISINTIRFHVKNIYDKLQVCNREEAIKKANDQRLI